MQRGAKDWKKAREASVEGNKWQKTGKDKIVCGHDNDFQLYYKAWLELRFERLLLSKKIKNMTILAAK